MPTFAYSSDWHLDFFSDVEPFPEFDRSADVFSGVSGIILDGPKHYQIERFLAHTEGMPTVLTTGNHDPYNSRDKTLPVLREAFADTDVTVLANKSLVIGGGYGLSLLTCGPTLSF